MSNYRLTAAVLMTILIGGGLFLYDYPKPAKVERPKNSAPVDLTRGFGFIDLDEIYNHLPNGEELKELRGREIRLRLELNEVMRPVAPPRLPEIDLTPFTDSAREKNMQNIIGQLSELRARRKRLAEEYRKKTEPEYLARRDAVTQVYLNEAFNITLKINNADVLRLKPEEVRALEAQLDKLVSDRNQSQGELLNDWLAEIENYVESQTADDAARIRRESDEHYQKYTVEAEQKIREVQERNRALMDAATKEVAARQIRRREILADLTETADARAKLESEILEEIVNDAGRLGAVYKLKAVFVKRAPNYAEEHFFYSVDTNFRLEFKKSPGAMIFAGEGTRDLTQELLKALRR
ncbi:MAG: hypothetical protein J5809_01220 [Selenomonadaceae bacterium]|nr:hypothetical protein [Selenomonadaceae bacterium]